MDYTSGYFENGENSSITERFLWEFVEDNDDQDRIPDWGRNDALSTDRAVFPGWDENNDFVPDFNQNDNTRRTNLIPDYEEPFLRQNVDRPEFLYGIDANNNAWIDRFENDNEPDFPYKRDHRRVQCLRRSLCDSEGAHYLWSPPRRENLHRPEELRHLQPAQYRLRAPGLGTAPDLGGSQEREG